MMKKLLTNPRQAKGITLLELMISMVVGMVVIGAVSSIYLMNVTATANTINSTRLMQTMNTMMTVMMNDIRRAGYVSTADPSDPTSNIFNANGDTALTVFNTHDGAALPFTNTEVVNGDTIGSCVLFAYDMDHSSSINVAADAPEVTGFRRVGDVVQMRSRKVASVAAAAARNGNCNDTTNDDWTDMNNASLIKITKLEFDFGNSVCLNTREPDGVDSDGDAGTDDDDEQNCYKIAAVNPDVIVETREIKITLEGELTSDTSAKYWLEQTVRVRNDLVREIP